MRSLVVVSAMLVVASSSAGAFAQPASKPAPPSTGREQPRPQRIDLSPEDAARLVALSHKRAQSGECEGVVQALSLALARAKLDKPAAVEGYLTLQRCATKTKSWRAVVRASSWLLANDSARANPDELVRAYAELGDFDRIPALAKGLIKKHPKIAPELSVGLSRALCMKEAWSLCAENAKRSIELIAKAKAKNVQIPSALEIELKSRVLLAQSQIALGDLSGYAEQRAALVGALGAKAPVAELDDSIARVKKHRAWIKLRPAKDLPLGTYHLLGQKETGDLVALRMINHDKIARTFRLEAEVSGATDRTVRSFQVPPKKTLDAAVTPPLRLDFDVNKIRAPRPGQIALRLIETTGGREVTIFDETPAIEILPRDHLPLFRHVGTDHLARTLSFIAAWITPNVKQVEEVLTKAKDRHPQRTFSGEQSGTIVQVKAIFEELKARGISYVMDPDVVSDSLRVQRTRLPAEVIGSTNAQCLEGTILFAAMLESIGLRPIIVTVPGHAYVGWWTTKKDGKVPPQVFLETTMVGNATFEQALETATLRTMAESKAGSFAAGASTMTDVAALRKRGFSPQPYE